MNLPLRVGIDYSAATRHAPGTGRYVRELVRALVSLEVPPAMHLLDIGSAPRTLVEPSLGIAGRAAVRERITSDVRRGAALLLARPFGVERWFGGLEQVHQVLRPLWPITRATSSLAISELPVADSEAEARLRVDLARIDQIHVFSEDYRERVRARFDIEPEHVVRVPVGCDHWRRELVQLPERADPALILVLGALRAERSPLQVLRSFEALVDGGVDAQLLFAGRAGDQSDAILRARDGSRHAARITWRSDVSEAELPRLVARASTLVHLSQEEGTAVTPLEALAVGTPVVASRLPALQELLEGEVEWAPELSESTESICGLTESIEKALQSAQAEDAIARRMTLAAKFTWRASAQATLDAWTLLTRMKVAR